MKRLPSSRVSPVSKVLLGLALGVWTTPARAADWPQFRGPNRDGAWTERGLLETFPTGGLNVSWRTPVGWGFSSPVVAQGRVFLTDSQLKRPAAKERLLCLDERTGETVWTFAYDVRYPDWVFVPGQGAGPTATPTVEAGKVYILGGNGAVHCLETETGTLVWQKDLGKEYEVREMSCRASPLIEGNQVIFFTGAKPGATLIALDKQTGKEVWKALDESASNSSPLVIAAGGKRQLIVWTGESVTSLDPATGRIYWREPMVTSNNDAIPTPVFDGNRLLIGGLMFVLDPHQPAASILWPETKVLSRRILSNTSTALLRGELVFSAKSNGELVCIDAATGLQIWSTNTVTDIKTGASIHLTPNGDAVFLFTDQGNLIRARLSVQGYYEVSRTRLLEPTSPFGGRKCAWTPPAFANGHVFARNEEEVVCASLVGKR